MSLTTPGEMEREHAMSAKQPITAMFRKASKSGGTSWIQDNGSSSFRRGRNPAPISSLADHSIHSHSVHSFRSLRSVTDGDSGAAEDGNHRSSGHIILDDNQSLLSDTVHTAMENTALEDCFFDAEKEAKLAVLARAMFVVVMIVAAILVAVGTSRYTNSKEQQAFETKVRRLDFSLQDDSIRII